MNDATTRGGSSIDGIMVPAGTTTVYDQGMGELLSVILHSYRQSPMEDRKYKSWVVGSAGGAATTTRNMEVHFLSSVHFVLWVLTTSSC